VKVQAPDVGHLAFMAATTRQNENDAPLDAVQQLVEIYPARVLTSNVGGVPRVVSLAR